MKFKPGDKAYFIANTPPRENWNDGPGWVKEFSTKYKGKIFTIVKYQSGDHPNWFKVKEDNQKWWIWDKWVKLAEPASPPQPYQHIIDKIKELDSRYEKRKETF